jgi:hypothetical protein
MLLHDECQNALAFYRLPYKVLQRCWNVCRYVQADVRDKFYRLPGVRLQAGCEAHWVFRKKRPICMKRKEVL